MSVHDFAPRDRDSNKAWIAALLSHELAAPLNAILGSISLLDGECPTDRCGLVLVDRKHIDRMRRNGCHLRAMMDGVLKLLRAEAGELEVSFARGALGAVVDDSLADVELKARVEPFQQAEAADRHRGSGVGLTISRQFARAMKGAIEVESEVGVGSAFTLWLAQHVDM